MKNRKMISQGIYVGIGLVLGNAVVLPLLSEKSFAAGIREGVIAGVMAMLFFVILAFIIPEKRD